MTVSQQIPAIVRSRGPDLAVLVKRPGGVPMLEALRLADEAGAVIASNPRLGRIIIGSEEWDAIKCAIPCRSGTIAAYGRPNQRIGRKIEYVDPKTEVKYVFPVPEAYRGLKNVVLVAAHPDFTLTKAGTDMVIEATKVDVVDRFPTITGWYNADSKHDLPQGDPLSGNYPEARYFFRKEKL